jgi:hypothetical protein
MARIMAVLGNGGSSADHSVTLLTPAGMANSLADPVVKPMTGLGDSAFVAGGWNAPCISGFNGAPIGRTRRWYGESGSYGWSGHGGSLAYFNTQHNLGIGWTITGMALSARSYDKRAQMALMDVLQALE